SSPPLATEPSGSDAVCSGAVGHRNCWWGLCAGRALPFVALLPPSLGSARWTRKVNYLDSGRGDARCPPACWIGCAALPVLPTWSVCQVCSGRGQGRDTLRLSPSLGGFGKNGLAMSY